MRGTWGAVFRYPPTWIAVLAVVGAAAAILLLLEPSSFWTIATIVVAVIAILAWPVTLGATGTLARLRYQSPGISSVSETEVRMLGDKLHRLNDSRPARQLERARAGRDRIMAMLDRRRKAGEMIYERYRKPTDLTFNEVVANLKRALESLPDGDFGPAPPDSRQQGQLPASQPGYTPPPARNDIPHDLADNDKAIALLERAATALGNAAVGLSSPEATEALKAIQDWADHANSRV